MAELKWMVFGLIWCLVTTVRCDDILCEAGFCGSYIRDPGCGSTAIHCSVNNATHTGLLLPSPTLCNCCDYCLPFYGEGEYCSTGGPGAGTTVGRCGDGLTCMTPDTDGHSVCTRMTSDCFRAQDDYDARELQGQVGALEHRPQCDGKGKYAAHYCIPTMTCFCQSEEGERIFGEALNLGTYTTQNMQCGCSRFHERIKKNISPGVQMPVVGPRCSADGNYNPIQCIERTCYCVDTVTGLVVNERSINLDHEPITQLPCYDPEFDLYPQYSEGSAPYNYTTPCIEDMRQKIELILKSEEDGYNIDFASSFPECLPDGTFGRMAYTRSGRKVCTNERGHQIHNFGAAAGSQEYNTMDCKCASVWHIMGDSLEKPICCKNGNFRRIQCRRGLCRCVDSNGRQTERETDDVTKLSCYTADWKIC